MNHVCPRLLGDEPAVPRHLRGRWRREKGVDRERLDAEVQRGIGYGATGRIERSRSDSRDVSRTQRRARSSHADAPDRALVHRYIPRALESIRRCRECGRPRCDGAHAARGAYGEHRRVGTSKCRHDVGSDETAFDDGFRPHPVGIARVESVGILDRLDEFDRRPGYLDRNLGSEKRPSRRPGEHEDTEGTAGRRLHDPVARYLETTSVPGEQSNLRIDRVSGCVEHRRFDRRLFTRRHLKAGWGYGDRVCAVLLSPQGRREHEMRGQQGTQCQGMKTPERRLTHRYVLVSGVEASSPSFGSARSKSMRVGPRTERLPSSAGRDCGTRRAEGEGVAGPSLRRLVRGKSGLRRA